QDFYIQDLEDLSDRSEGWRRIVIYYQAHRKDYEPTTIFWTSHIVVKTKPQAIQLLQKLRQHQVTFHDTALHFSIDAATARNNADLPAFTAGDKPAAFEKLIRSMKFGDLAGPYPVAQGFEIIRKNGQKYVPQKSRQEIAGDIKKQLALQVIKAHLALARS